MTAPCFRAACSLRWSPWDWSKGDADAVKIELSTQSGSFHWSGSFGRPAILADTGGPFVQHPIPQDVWGEGFE